MSILTKAIISLALGAAIATTTLAPAARATSFGALQAIANSPGGLTFERARQMVPGLQRVTFDHADRNGDGVIDAAEFPAFQAMLRSRLDNR